MGLLTSEDKEYIKRALPKSSNKVIDVAIARLFIAYPNPNEWQYTGLSGAIALVDDLVGHTFFLKLVDIKGHNGVLWDQELYVNFEYSQDRTFFHSFEIEECYAGLLFDDLGEASHFLKRVQKRERYASKKTLSNKNAIALTKKVNEEQANELVHGPRGESLMGNQRERYNYDNVESIPATKTKAPPPPPPSGGANISSSESDNNDDYNSDWASAPSAPSTPAPQIPSVSAPDVPTQTAVRHAVPPLPAQFSPPQGQVPQRQASQEHAPPVSPTAQSQGIHKKDNPFPFPIPQSSAPNGNNPFPFPVPPQLSSAQNTPFPVPGVAPFQSPPSNNRPLPALPNRNARAVPAPPIRNIPTGARNTPPVPPSRRGPAPPPPPHRNAGAHPANNFVYNQNTGSNVGRPPAPPPPRRGPAPPPPPRSSRLSNFSKQSPIPQPQAPGGYYNNTASQQPQAPGGYYNNAASQQLQAPNFPAQQQQFQQPPPPPPTPPTTFNNMPAVNGASAPPPPPSFLTQSQPQASGPPPPPPSFLTQPQPQSPAPPSLPHAPNGAGDGGRDALLASIRGAGIGTLRKVDKTQLDRPSVLLQEAHGQTPQPAPSSGPAPAGGAPTSLADALAAALNKRKTKVGSGDFEDGDDW